MSDAAREAAERTVLTHPLRPWTRTSVCSLPGTASRAVADAASGASERPTSQVVSPTTCDNIVNAVKVVDGFKGDVCSHAPPAPPESCKSGLESLWRRTCMTDGSNCDGLEHGAFTPSAVSNPRMQVRSRPTATQWQWRSDRRSTVAKRGRGTTGASADGDTYRCQGISRKSPEDTGHTRVRTPDPDVTPAHATRLERGKTRSGCTLGAGIKIATRLARGLYACVRRQQSLALS